MIKQLKYSIAFFFLLALSLKAYSTSLQMEVDRETISSDDSFVVQVILEGGSGADEYPSIENSENFRVRENGVSSQTQIINGSMTRKVVFNYVAIPKKEGVFTFGPARLNYQGQNLSSNKIKIKVTKPENLGDEKLRAFFLKTEVDNETPYVGEQIVYSFRLFVRDEADVRSLNLTSLPDFQGFWKEELGKQRNYSTVINGIRWNVTELKYALFPNREGKLTINGSTLEGQMIVPTGNTQRRRGFNSFFNDSFFQRGVAKPIHVESKPFDVDVKPLPEEGRPTDFNGHVGRYVIKADVSKKQMKVGDSATVTFTIKGDGNVRDIKIPELNWKEFKTYDDKPQLQVGGSDRLIGVKTIKKALVPMKEGQFTIPGLKISYFDTHEKRYRYLSTEDFYFEIFPGDKGVQSGTIISNSSTRIDPGPKTKKEEIKLIGRDLMPLMKISDAKKSRPFTFVELIVYWLLFILSPLSYFIIFFWKKKRDLLSADETLLLYEKAYSLYKKREKSLKGNSNDFYIETSRVLREYLGNKLRLEGHAITPIDAERVLSGHLSSEIIEEVKDILRELDMGQYGGLTKDREGKVKIKNKMINIVKKVEKGVK